MNILITGSKGFVGQNLIILLKSKYKDINLLEFDLNNTITELEQYCKKADRIFHLAAIQRPNNPKDFSNNVDLTRQILFFLQLHSNHCPIMFSSSIQAELDNEYGISKRQEELTILNFGKSFGSNTYIFRFPNMFGIMSRPNYTSVVSTFCYNTSHGIPITINDPSSNLKIAFVEDVLNLVQDIVINDKDKMPQIIQYEMYTTITLGELAFYVGTIKSNKEVVLDEKKVNFYSKLKIVYKWFEAQS